MAAGRRRAHVCDHLDASAIGLRNFAALQQRSWTTLLLITIAPVALVGMFLTYFLGSLFFFRAGRGGYRAA